MLTPLLFVGAGGTAADALEIVAEINRMHPTYECVGLLDDDPMKLGSWVGGVSVVGTLADAARHPEARLVDALGSPSSFRHRAGVIARAGLAPERFVSIVHPAATVSVSSTMGMGVIVYPGVVVCARVVIADHVIVLANSVLNHDVTVGEFSIVASGVNVSGSVAVGQSSYLGVGSSVIQNITIGEGALVGAGAVVIRDVPPRTTVVGNPARVIRPGIADASEARGVGGTER